MKPVIIKSNNKVICLLTSVNRSQIIVILSSCTIHVRLVFTFYQGLLCFNQGVNLSFGTVMELIKMSLSSYPT